MSKRELIAADAIASDGRGQAGGLQPSEQLTRPKGSGTIAAMFELTARDRTSA